MQYTIPRYLKIAVDLSARIASGDIREGEKLKGRSLLASEYKVSPETIRRAMSILSDKKVVEILLGSGIVVVSKEQAIRFVKSFKEDESVSDMRVQLSILADRRCALEKEYIALAEKIIDMYKYRRSDVITPVEVSLPPRSHVVGKSIGDLQVWHNTGATIIGVIQDNNIIVSPGPYYAFDQNDRVLIVGDANVIERFNAFLRQTV
jgi:K+/H+ antiporter YhaU regulatory subunit KhtT